MMRITRRDLPSTARVLTVRKLAAVELDDETLVALAERALAQGRKPAALFQWMLSHPESWAWVSEEDRAEARKRLSEHRRVKRGPKARPVHAKRSRTEWGSLGLKRFYGVDINSKRYASSGWEAEAQATAEAWERRLRRRAFRERVERLVGVLVVGLAVLWLFF